MNIDDASMFSASERIVQEHVKKYKTGAAELKDLIQEVLHHPDFNPRDVDHDMHQRLMDCITHGNIEVIDLWEEGDGAQEVMLYKRPVLKVLRELIADERLAGRQHFVFVLYKDENGERILACEANGSVTFQMAQERIGPGKVPISIVLYIDGTFIKRGIPVRPVYRELNIMIYTMLYTMIHVMLYIMLYTMIYTMLYIMIYVVNTNSVVSVGCLNNDRTVMGRSFAWRPLACLPILKGSACTNTDKEWQRLRRLSLYHRAMDHIVADVNQMCSIDRYYRFADKVVRPGRAFWHLLSMDGAEIAAATLCGTDNCPTCECPKAELDNTEKTYPLRKTSDVKKAVDDGRARLLNADESVKTNKKSAVPY